MLRKPVSRMRAGCVGGGDCDDFAILMSALIESVGGTTRIILARNSSTGGHAYTEVYLGNLSEQNNQVEDIIAWLKQEVRHRQDLHPHRYGYKRCLAES